jgi:hypothetical protein
MADKTYCARCDREIEEQEQPAGSGYGYTHVDGTRFCSGTTSLAHPLYKSQ